MNNSPWAWIEVTSIVLRSGDDYLVYYTISGVPEPGQRAPALMGIPSVFVCWILCIQLFIQGAGPVD